MKILYGIQGTGNGHISRARMMAKYFNAQSADVSYVFSGRERKNYFDMEVFGDFANFRGLTFSTKAGKIDYWDTIKHSGLVDFIRDVRSIDIKQYDLVVTDFEPISAWAGKLAGKKVIGVGHQYAFGPATPKAGYNMMAGFIMRYFAPADIGIGLHWHQYDNNSLPPIIDTSLSREPAEQAAILVYLPFEDQQYISDLLRQFPQHHFIQYSPELNDSEQDNISLRKTSLGGFKRDLKAATAVLSNSGFELVSECIHLGLPVLVKPLHGQFEQLSNALALSELRYGASTDKLNQAELAHWLDNIEQAKSRRFPDVAKAVVDWILAGETDVKALSDQLWSA